MITWGSQSDMRSSVVALAISRCRPWWRVPGYTHTILLTHGLQPKARNRQNETEGREKRHDAIGENFRRNYISIGLGFGEVFGWDFFVRAVRKWVWWMGLLVALAFIPRGNTYQTTKEVYNPAPTRNTQQLTLVQIFEILLSLVLNELKSCCSMIQTP